MEKDFHYHLIYSITRCVGFSQDEASITAYASQFVDDNNEGQFTVDKKEIGFPQKLKANGGYYYPVMTQSLSPKSLDHYIQRYVYLPFHFLPGDNDAEIKGKKNPFSTTPNSRNANTLLDAALKRGDLYQIGIALHTFADTWSHQNFSAFREDWNSVYPWYNVFKSLVPNIGHAEVGHLPDQISYVWIDHRFDDLRVDNRERAIDAVETTFERLKGYTGEGHS